MQGIAENKKNIYLCTANAKIAQLVEHNLAKVRVAGSSPVFRSKTLAYARVFFNKCCLDGEIGRHATLRG